MNEERYRVIDVIFRLTSGMIAFVILIVGWTQYREIKEREFKKVFYESQVHVVNDLFEAMTNVDLAITDADKKAAVSKFWMLYTGKARLYLNHEMFAALEMPAEYVAGCVERRKKPGAGIECSMRSSMMMAGFAKTSREQLSRSWDEKFEQIGNADPWASKSSKQCFCDWIFEPPARTSRERG